MSLSSGHRTLLGEVASWVVFAGVCVAAVTHFDQLKAIAHQIAGTDPADLQMAAATDRTPADDQAASHPTSHGSTGGYLVEIKMGPDGHYHADAEINGRDVAVLVDTGASVVALTYEDAESAGIFVSDKDFTHRTQTANGTARVAPVMLDTVTIGDITLRDVCGIVSEPGALSVTLLGMTFLNRLDRVDMRSGTLILED